MESDFKKRKRPISKESQKKGEKGLTIIRENSGPAPVTGRVAGSQTPLLAAHPSTFCPLDEVLPLINTLTRLPSPNQIEPGPDGPNVSSWYGRLRGLMSPFSLLYSDQL